MSTGSYKLASFFLFLQEDTNTGLKMMLGEALQGILDDQSCEAAPLVSQMKITEICSLTGPLKSKPYLF